MLRLGLIGALAILASFAPVRSQGSGSVYPSLVNTCGSGTPLLDVAVHFPTTAAGALVPRTGGWPVIVFLHGFNVLGYDYHYFGSALAAEGFIVVMANTARTNYLELNDDARSMPAALAAWNATPGHSLSGALDIDRMGLMGHSMGGGVTAMTLASTDEYRCGLAIAPVHPGAVTLGVVEEPFGLLVGDGDAVTPWLSHSAPFFVDLGTAVGLRFLYLMDGRVDHINVVGLWQVGLSPIAVRSVLITAGWFHHMLEGTPDGLEQVLGQGAANDAYRLQHFSQVLVPQTWAAAPAKIGRSLRLSVACESGLGAVFGASSFVAGLPTPLGVLYLDPGSMFLVGLGVSADLQRIDIELPVPNNTSLIGVQLPLQGLGTVTTDPLLLGSHLVLTVVQ